MRPEDHFRLLLDDLMIEREGQLLWPRAHPGGGAAHHLGPEPLGREGRAACTIGKSPSVRRR